MANDSFCNHVIKCAFDLFPVFYEYLSLGMLYQGYRRVGPDGVGTMLKTLWYAHFNAIMSWTWAVVQGEVALGDCAFGVGQR